MRKRISLLLGIVLLWTLAAHAQFTVVTGTVLDPNGLPYAQGTIAPVLVSPGGTSVTLNEQAYSPPTQPVGIANDGTFTMQIAANASLAPGGTQWNFITCSAVGTVPPALGFGSRCFQLSTPITIAGATQDISTNLQLVALALTRIGNGGCSLTGTGPCTLFSVFGTPPTVPPAGQSAYSFDVAGNPVVSVNGLAYNQICLFTSGCGATPGGNAFDVQFNQGGVALGGSDNFRLPVAVTPPGSNYLGTTPTAFIVGRLDAATNILNQFSNVLQLQGNYWNGAASAADTWWIYEGARPNGGGSRSSLVFNHTGANGSSNGSQYNVVFSGDNTADAGTSCQHEDPLYTTNSALCMFFGSANTAGSGVDVELQNTATAGSQRTRLIQAGNFAANPIYHMFETDPNTTGASEWGAQVANPLSNYPYLFINNVSTNLPDLYLGGSAWSGASGAAIKIQIDNGGARRLVAALAGASIDFTAPTGANATLPMQVKAGATSTTNGGMAYDSTNDNVHLAHAGADAVAPVTTVTPTNGNCVKWAVSGGSFKLDDQGATCPSIPVTAAQGGTGINTSASTGTPSIAAGVWSVVAAPTGGQITVAQGGASSAGTLSGVNTTRMWSFTANANVTGCNHFQYHVQTADNSANLYNIAIVDVNGAKQCEIGATAGTTLAPATGVRLATTWTGSGVFVLGQRYYLIFTGNATTMVLGGLGASSAALCLGTPASNGTTAAAVWTYPVTAPADTYATCTQPNIAFN